MTDLRELARSSSADDWHRLHLSERGHDAERSGKPAVSIVATTRHHQYCLLLRQDKVSVYAVVPNFRDNEAGAAPTFLYADDRGMTTT